jgi:hypothetical protein
MPLLDRAYDPRERTGNNGRVAGENAWRQLLFNSSHPNGGREVG